MELNICNLALVVTSVSVFLIRSPLSATVLLKQNRSSLKWDYTFKYDVLNCQIGLYFLNQFPSCLMERLQPVFLLPVLLRWFETTTTMLVKCKTVKTHLYCSCQCTFCGNREALEEGCWEGASAAHSVPDPLYSRLCSRSATAFVLREAGCCLALPCPGELCWL